VYLALYARRAWVIFDHPYNAEYARESNSLRSRSRAQIIQFGSSSRVAGRRMAQLAVLGAILRRKPAMHYFGNAVPMRAVSRGANMMMPS
jgi:hypothetical protein